MRSDPARRSASGSAWVQRTVQVSRGHWHREEPGARSAGWWESVTVTWSPPRGAERRPSLPARALAAAIDMIAPAAAELVAAGARRLLERPLPARPLTARPLPARPLLQRPGRALPPPARRALRAVPRQLPRSRQPG